MIKEIPGWANYAILWAGYSGLVILLDFLFVKGRKKPEMDWLFDAFVAAVFCGVYLAKWQHGAMIRSLPGWANYLILWTGYSLLAVLLDFLFVKGGKKPRMDWLFDVFIAAVYCGAYLAKWRFYDGGWHFS